MLSAKNSLRVIKAYGIAKQRATGDVALKTSDLSAANRPFSCSAKSHQNRAF